MFTRGLLTRPWSADRAGLVVAPVNGWSCGQLVRGGVMPLQTSPIGGPGFGWATDPSDPKTWRRPLRFT